MNKSSDGWLFSAIQRQLSSCLLLFKCDTIDYCVKSFIFVIYKVLYE